MDFNLVYRRFSEYSILIEWPLKINENILNDVHLFKQYLLSLNVKSIVQINNAYNSILVIYDYAIDKINDEILMLKNLYVARVSVNKSVSKIWKIPVCYNEEFGLDLKELSVVNKLPIPEIIKIHSNTTYTVFFIGFLPGFLYLGGLDKRIHFPRKISPRQHVQKGAVAIGGQQTGVYPDSSPGGWNIIGSSPLEFFNSSKKIPCFAKAGDKIQFVAVSEDEYHQIRLKVNNGTYQIESEVVDG